MYNIRGSCQEKCFFRTVHGEVTDIISHTSGTITKLQNQLKHDIRDPSDTITKGGNQFIDQEKSVFRTENGKVIDIIPHTLNILSPNGFK
jgi:hypothetical protein